MILKLRLLVHYLSTTLLPSLPTLAGPPPGSAHQGRFLVPGGGPAGDQVREPPRSSQFSLAGENIFYQTTEAVPVVHLGPGETRHLVVYHAVTSTLCLLLPAAPATQVTICWDYLHQSLKQTFAKIAVLQ